MAKNNIHQQARKNSIADQATKNQISDLIKEGDKVRKQIEEADAKIEEATEAYQSLPSDASEEAKTEAQKAFNEASEARDALQSKLEEIEDEASSLFEENES